MRKSVTFIVCSCLSVNLFAANSGWFSSLFSADKKEDILTYVPADTAYYFGGDSSEKIAEIMNASSVLTSSPRLIEQFNNMLDTSDGGDVPETAFLRYFLDQYQHANDTGLVDLAKATGVSFTGAYAVFSDGIFPVARINVANSNAVDVLIENAVKDSGWEYRWENIGNEKIRLWSMDDGFFLAVLNNDQGVVITVLNENDTLENKQRRLGLIKPDASLATNKTVAALKTKYGYTDDMVGFIQIDYIAEAYLSPKNSRLGRDFLTYLPSQPYRRFQRGITEACRVELAQFTSAAPRFVTGYQHLESNINETSYTSHSVLELENDAVSLSLQNAQGYLPTHSTTAKNKLLAFGVGIDGDAFGPEFLSLVGQFSDATYNCAALNNLKGLLINSEPMNVVNASALFKGVKGLGVSLFDLTFDEKSGEPESVDFLISIATEDPASLVDNAQKMPLVPQTTLPEDGSSVPLDLPIQTPFEVNAAMKGKHIAIYSGDQSAILANELITEPIGKNGLASLSMNFQTLGEQLSSEDLNKSFAAMPYDDDCSMQYELAYTLQSVNTENELVISVEPEGFATNYSSYLDKTQSKDINLVGEYNVSYQDENCQWIGVNEEESTKDQVRENGTGLYVVRDEASMCDLYISDYTWQQNGNKFVVNSQDQERDSCDTALSEKEETDYTCYLVADKDAEFLCVYSFDGFVSVEKYTRLAD